MGVPGQGELPGKVTSEGAERLRRVTSLQRALEDFAAANPGPDRDGYVDVPPFLVNRQLANVTTTEELDRIDPRTLSPDQLLIYSKKREELGLVGPAEVPASTRSLDEVVADLPPAQPLDEKVAIPLPSEVGGEGGETVPPVVRAEPPGAGEVAQEDTLESVLQGSGAGGGEAAKAVMDEALRGSNAEPSPNSEYVLSKTKLVDATRMREDAVEALTEEEVASIEDLAAREYIENRRKHLEYKKYNKEQVLALPEASISGLSDAEVDLIQDEEARNEFRRRRSELNNKRYENMQVQDLNNMSEDEIAGVTDEQLNAIRNEDARKALRLRVEASRTQRAQEQERIRYRTLSARGAAQLEDVEVRAMTAAQIDAIDDENARRVIRTRQDNLVRAEAEANRFENLNTDTIDSLSEDELVAITDEQIDRVTDPRAKTVLREKRRAAQEAAESRRNLESIKTFVESGIDIDTIFTTPEQIPGFNSLPRPLQEVIRANMANRDALRKNQLEGDKFKKKEEEASARLENLKLAKKERELFFRQMKFIFGGLVAGVAVGAMLSGGGDAGRIIALGAMGLGGGLIADGVDEKFSIDRAKIEYEIAKSKSKIQENQSNLIRLKDRAIKRDVSTLTAYSTIAGEIFARGTGITDEAQKKKFIGDFQREMGVPVMNAILAV